MEIQMSEHTKKAMRQIFESKDETKTGTLDKGEFEACLHAVGFCPTTEDVNFLCEAFDSNGDGQLRIDELVENLDVINAHSIKGKELMNAFRVFDLYQDGCIRPSELRISLTAPGPAAMSREAANELVTRLLAEFDMDKDGKFSYAEFVRILMKGALPEGMVKL